LHIASRIASSVASTARPAEALERSAASATASISSCLFTRIPRSFLFCLAGYGGRRVTAFDGHPRPPEDRPHRPHRDARVDADWRRPRDARRHPAAGPRPLPNLPLSPRGLRARATGRRLYRPVDARCQGTLRVPGLSA